MALSEPTSQVLIVGGALQHQWVSAFGVSSGAECITVHPLWRSIRPYPPGLWHVCIRHILPGIDTGSPLFPSLNDKTLISL